MTGFKNLLLAFTVLGASSAAHAGDDSLASLVFGQTSGKVKKSRVLNRASVNVEADSGSTWGKHLGQKISQSDYSASYDNVSVSHNGIKLRQEDLMGRYDLPYPVSVSNQS